MLLILNKILWLLSILFSISLLNAILYLIGIRSISFILFIILIALLTIIIKLVLNKYIYTDFSNDVQFNNNSNIEDGIVNNINDESSDINEIDDIDSINKINIDVDNINRNLDNSDEYNDFIRYIINWFSSNLLLKVGGILLFLGVLFLLNIVYSYLGPISKIVLGFLISIVIYLIALYLNNKSYILESKLLFGTSLAINYLVILAGRYLIEISSINTDYVFNETITFYLLVLNTIFFVFTSILYKFDDLLIGSFFISYCVPFLIGASNNSPYSLIFYSLLVTFGILSMLLFYKKDFNPIYTNIIILIAYFGGNILVVLSPVFISFHLLLKLISVICILIFSIVIVIKYNRINYLYLFVIFSYLFVYIISFNSNSLYYIAFIFIILAVVFLVYKFLSYLNILITLVVPLLLLIHLFLSYNSINDDFLVNRCYIIVFTILVYVLIGIDIINKINNVQRYIYILLLSIFVVISNIIIYNVGSITETFVIEHYIILISTMILFLLLCLLFIIYDLTALYPISMILTYAGLLPVISREDDFALISIFSVILIGIISVILPLSKLALIQNNNITHFIYGIVISGIANCLWVYYFLFGDQQLSYTTIGFIYVIVALLYFSVGTIIYYLSNKPQFQNIINIIYTFFGISVSVFSLSILFIFIDNPSIVSSVWLFESTILFYLYYKLNDSRIFVSANILMLLGASKIINPLFILYIHHYDYIYILYVIFVIISILISLFFVTRSTINNIVSKLCFFTYHFLYILIIICLYVIIFIVINSSSFYLIY